MNKRLIIKLLDALSLPPYLDDEPVYRLAPDAPLPHYGDLSGTPLPEALDFYHQNELVQAVRRHDDRSFRRAYLYSGDLWIAVLTSYLGMNQQTRPGAPLLLVWETFVQFDSGNWIRRYSTLAAAHQGHRRIIETLTGNGMRLDREENGLLR